MAVRACYALLYDDTLFITNIKKILPSILWLRSNYENSVGRLSFFLIVTYKYLLLLVASSFVRNGRCYNDTKKPKRLAKRAFINIPAHTVTWAVTCSEVMPNFRRHKSDSHQERQKQQLTTVCIYVTLLFTRYKPFLHVDNCLRTRTFPTVQN